MSLTEADVISRLKSSMREAIQASNDLAVKSRLGAPYQRLRDHLALIEGCCRQLAAFRDDATWLPFGIFAAECHKRAGSWLRGKTIGGDAGQVHIFKTDHEKNQLFVKLAEMLTHILEAVDIKTNAATHTVGAILPKPPAEERRTGRPAFDHSVKRKPTLIIPAKYRRAG